MNELDRSPAIACDEVREGLALLHRGGAGLTDWALIERHVRGCEACRTREHELRQAASTPQRPQMARPPRYWLEKLQDESQVRVAGLATWAGPQLAIARSRSELAAGWLIQAVLAAAAGLVAMLARIGSLLAGLIRAGALAAAGLFDVFARLGRLSMIVGRSAGRFVIAAAGAAVNQVPRGLDLLMRLIGSGLALLSMAGRPIGVAVGDAGASTTQAGASAIPPLQALAGEARRLFARATTTLGHAGLALLTAGRAGVARIGVAGGRAAQLIGEAFERAVIRASGTTQGIRQRARALVASVRSVVVYAARPPVLTAGTAMVGLVILVAATPLWWPRGWQIERLARPSAPRSVSASSPDLQIARAPIDRKSAEAPVTARLIRRSRPVPSPDPLGLAEETSAPARGEQGPARDEASVTRPTGLTALPGSVPPREAPRRQERAATQRVSAESSDDASAAVDWLLGNTRARKSTENP